MKLNYKVLGEGRPVIILHGLFGTLDNWFTHAKDLSSDYQVYLVDQRNHGLSPHADEWTYEAMAADLKEFIEDHHIEDPILLGHSMGGKTVMRFASEYPEVLAALIVVDIAPKYYPPHHGDILKGLNAVDLPAIKTRSQAEAMLVPFISEFGVRQFLLKNLKRKEEGGYSWKMNLSVIEAQIENVGEALATDQGYDGTTVFIRGAKSNYILDDDFVAIQDQFPLAELITIHDAGHWVHAEQPAEFISNIKAFLNRVA